jgi:tetratricopeptide (TPR) repeat protein
VSVGLLLTLSTSASAEDVVRMRGEQDRGEQVLTGRVVEYTGRELRLESPGQAPRSYPGDRVIEIQTEWVAAHDEARRALAASDFSNAIRLLYDATSLEQRTWVRRMIVADLVEAYAGAGRMAEAGDAFLTLALSDPDTPYFYLIPLSWTGRDAAPRAKAEAWLATDSPIATLLGASHLAGVDSGQPTTDALRRLADHLDPRIAALAIAQLWRTQIVAADLTTVAAWERRIDSMPESLQAGPLLTQARAWAHHGKWDQAAQAALRAAVLHPHPRGLAAESFASAGEALARAGRQEDATRMLDETMAQFPGLPAARAAEALLHEIRSGSTLQNAAPPGGGPAGDPGALRSLPPR